MQREDSNESQNSGAASTSSHSQDEEDLPEPETPQQYEFLSGLDKSYSSTTRAHVLQRHMRARRKRGKQRTSGSGSDVAVPALRPTSRPYAFRQGGYGDRSTANANASANSTTTDPFPPPASIARKQHYPQMTAASVSCNGQGEDTFGADASTGTLVLHRDHFRSNHRPRRPMAMTGGTLAAEAEDGDDSQYFPPVSNLLGQGRVDPFSTFARQTTPRENYFMDHYITSSMSYYKLLDGTRFHPLRDVCFPVNTSNEASICAMIAYSARNLGMSMPTIPIEALTYRAETVRLINKNLSDPKMMLSDGNLMAVVGAIAYDKETGAPTEPSTDLPRHIQGLRQMIIARGGFGVIVKDPGLSWVIHWMDMLNDGAITAGLTPLSTHAFCAPARLKIPGGGTSSAQSTLFPDPEDIRPFAEELIGAYGNFFREAQSRAATALMTSLYPAASSHLPIHQIFRRGTPVHRLLTDPSTILTISRNLVPLYLNIILWDCRAQPAVLVNRYFKRVRLAMVDEGLDVGGVVEVLFWVLMTDPDHRIVADPERIWLVARLLWVESRLSLETRHKLETTLMQFLTAGEPDEKSVEWGPDQFRRDVLTELGLSDEDG